MKKRIDNYVFFFNVAYAHICPSIAAELNNMIVSDSLKKILQSLDRSPLVWESMTWTQIEGLQRQGMDMCILPVGATEQHGPHLPVNTDSVIATAVCLYASAKTGVPVLPTITYGCSLGHTEQWSGTLSLYPETPQANG